MNRQTPNQKRKKRPIQFQLVRRFRKDDEHARRNEDVEYSEVFDALDPDERRFTSEWEKNKYLYAFSYFIFFLPFFLGYTPRVRFYANQGLMVWIWLIVGNVFFYYLGFIPRLEVTMMLVQWLFSTLIVFLAFYGLIRTLQDEREVRLPIIGRARLIR